LESKHKTKKNDDKLTWDNLTQQTYSESDKGWNTENKNEITKQNPKDKTKSFIQKENTECSICKKIL